MDTPTSLDISRSSLLKAATQVIVPTAILGAIVYYFGWTASSAYYSSFGLSAGYMGFTLPETLAAGWFEAAIGLVWILLGLLLFHLVQLFPLGARTESSQWGHYLYLSYLAFSLVSALGVLLFFRLYVTIGLRISILLVLTFALGLGWIAALVGRRIVITNQSEIEKGFSDYRWFRIAYPGFYTTLVLTILVAVFTLSRISAWRGIYVGERDTNHLTTHLPELNIFSQKVLPIPDSTVDEAGLYKYESLYLIAITNEHIFLLGPGSKNNENESSQEYTTYTLPNDSSIVLEIGIPN